MDTGLYHDSGFFWNFPVDPVYTATNLTFLKENNWIDKATQYFRMDLSTFNSNVGYFVNMEFVRADRWNPMLMPRQRVWFKPSGWIKPEWNFYSIRADFYSSFADSGRAVGAPVVVCGS